MIGSPPLEYRCRTSILEPEYIWLLEDDKLIRRAEGKLDHRIPLTSITVIRFQDVPTRYLAERSLCRLSASGRVVAELQSGHFEGLANFSDRSASYLPFIVALVRRRRELGAGCQVMGGSSMIGWALQGTLLLGSLLAITLVILFFRPALAWTIGSVVFIFSMMPRAARWLRRNRPRSFELDAIPEELLPALTNSTLDEDGQKF